MAVAVSPGVIVYVCTHSIPQGARLPRQWNQEGAHVVVREVPCSGKMDAQYLFHALEGGARGVCVVACPKGKCHLAQGNYRAEVRLRTIRRLLTEIGMEPGRAEMIHAGDASEPISAQQIEQLLRDAVGRICAFGESPLRG